MTIELRDIYYLSPGDTELVYFDCADHLGSETVATPTVAQVGTTSLTISGTKATTATQTIGNRTVTAGQAVQALVTGFVVNTTYTIQLTAVTNGTPARTFVRRGKIICK